MADIAFLHTSAVHVATFDSLLKTLAPHRTATHQVREDLLAGAQRDGIDDPSLARSLRAAVDDAASDARVVVCTCSTIGGLAERLQARVPVTRIDRAMADEAVRRRAPVRVVAALQSTLQPTADLLQSSAERLGVPLVQRSLWVEGAWAHFEAGRQDAYLDTIATAVRRAAEAQETIVLAQASMASAALALEAAGFTVLSSPRLGVAHALRLCGPDTP